MSSSMADPTCFSRVAQNSGRKKRWGVRGFSEGSQPPNALRDVLPTARIPYPVLLFLPSKLSRPRGQVAVLRRVLFTHFMRHQVLLDYEIFTSATKTPHDAPGQQTLRPYLRPWLPGGCQSGDAPGTQNEHLPNAAYTRDDTVARMHAVASDARPNVPNTRSAGLAIKQPTRETAVQPNHQVYRGNLAFG